MKIKKIVFLTGTRADFGKLKPLINKIEQSKQFKCYIFATGMHTLSKYGFTFDEIRKQKYKEIYAFMNQTYTTDMDIILANTVIGFSNFINEINPDMIVIHGDRLEALAGAIVGSFNNILVTHIEGGELSGTIDELIRHAITKLSHIHLVSNKEAKKRLMQMGEDKKSIHIIGSPDIDIMYSNTLPTIKQAKSRYGIKFDDYSVLIYHPVTTRLKKLRGNIIHVVSAVKKSNKNYVVVYPNNDKGSDIILNEYKRFKNNKHFRVFSSIRFEHFLTLLKHSNFVIGNSSAGIRESEIYGVPSINIGSRQKNRSTSKNIINVSHNKDKILLAIERAERKKVKPISHFGKGNSSELFYKLLLKKNVWKIPVQKQFIDR